MPSNILIIASLSCLQVQAEAEAAKPAGDGMFGGRMTASVARLMQVGRALLTGPSPTHARLSVNVILRSWPLSSRPLSVEAR
jgi:hypothetical protein